MFSRINPDNLFSHHMPDVRHATARGNGKKNGIPHQVKTTDSGEQSSLSRFSEPQSRKLLNDRILSALAEHIDPSGKFKFADVEKVDFSPEAVSKRILGFVEGALAQAGGNEQAKNRLQAAREGIEKGFGEARDILTNLNVYQGEVQDNAEKTYDLLQQGLDGLQSALDDGTLFNKTAPAAPQLIQRDLLQQSSYSREESFELTVKTRDGDDVTINISRNQFAEDISYSSETPNSRFTSLSETTSASASFSYEVKGELDEGERKAIDELLGNVKKLSDEFFGSDVQGAFDHALSIGYDTKEIARFSVSMQQTEERRVTSAYREIAQIQDQGRRQGEALGKLLQPVHQFLDGLKQTVGDAQKTDMFDSPAATIADMFSGVSRIQPDLAELIAHLEERAKQSLEGITHQMVDQVKPFTS